MPLKQRSGPTTGVPPFPNVSQFLLPTIVFIMISSSSWNALSLVASTASFSRRIPAVASAFVVSRRPIGHENIRYRQIQYPQQRILSTRSFLLPHSQRQPVALGDNDIQPTWTHNPNNPNDTTNTTQQHPQQRRRNFSTITTTSSSSSWVVPKSIDIPEDKIEINFVRSSGAGGQNVNKVNTKVELRVDVMSSSWIPNEVRERLNEQQSNRINKDGVLTLTSQEYRTQNQNKKAALSKLQSMILQAWERPKVRKQRTGISKASKERNIEFKRRRSDVKQNRKKVDW